ncbi:DUF1492 domain-containing protein [Iocasia frigidifontis]|uniref:DUF1492 domain-containing protein n=1 Tax=Iocasia fonsfrigidae TaxID=2682810 RepID=A0A8A7K4C0_9FIRM|nr:helix-turn-helix domain-containing protein [Iocasia fonsfrigidae]QTL96546.1 DUF1492 domain-containing protein [Iocasia fonsfrigidae]
MTIKAGLDNSVFRFVEHELYNYQETIKDLKEINHDDIETKSSGNLLPYDRYSSNRSYPWGSSTEDCGIDLITNKIAYRMKRTIEAIGRAKKRLDDEKKELFRLKYQKGMSWQQITIEINISRRTYYRWRDEIVYITAEEMGLC